MKEAEPFIFFPSFAKQIEKIKDKNVRYAILQAIVQYGCYGESPDFSEIDPFGALDAAFLPMEELIDRAKASHKIRQEAGKAGGKKGGGNPNFVRGKSNPYYSKDKGEIKQDKGEIKQDKGEIKQDKGEIKQDKGEINLNKDKNKDKNNNKRESVKEKSEFSLSTNKHALEDCDENLLAWMKENDTPYILSHYTHLVSSTELAKLKEKYSTKRIMETIGQIENYVLYRKRYVNLYRVLLNWLKKGDNNG